MTMKQLLANAAISAFLFCLTATLARAAEMPSETNAAYDRYVAATERRIDSELGENQFLFVDALPPPRRDQAYDQLRSGETLIQEVSATEAGRPVEVPHGLIHDWMGLLFIPHASLGQTLAILGDYSRYQQIYRPQVRNSRLISRNGDDSKVFLQLYKKSVVTVAFNAEFDVHFENLGPGRALIRSLSTRIAEVQNAGESNERELSPEASHGFLWRLCDFWRFEEKDGGVYVQLESIGLSRSVPAFFAWIVNPLIHSIPRGTIFNLLAATRTAVRTLPSPANSPQPSAPAASSPHAPAPGANISVDFPFWSRPSPLWKPICLSVSHPPRANPVPIRQYSAIC
jgi:hypothetical protein